MDVSRHDTDFTLARLNNTGAVRTNETSGVLLKKFLLDQYHVSLGDTFSDTNNELDA